MSAAELTKADLFLKDSNAVISACGQHRYWLHRRWHTGAGWAVFVMFNPSTADAETDDPTIRVCTGFAKRWGCEGLIVVNLFSWRATHPEQLLKADYPVGEENHAYVSLAVEMADECFAELPAGKQYPGKLICAWGNNKFARLQVPTMLGWLDHALVPTMCLAKTKDGSPVHPLRQPYARPPIPFDWNLSR